MEAHCLPIHGVIWLHKCKFVGAFEAVPKATWVISIFPPSHSSPIQNSRRSPEHSNQRGVNGVSIIHVHMVPAALCGKVIEAQPEYCIRTDRQGERGDGMTKIHFMNIYYLYRLHLILTFLTFEVSPLLLMITNGHKFSVRKPSCYTEVPAERVG